MLWKKCHCSELDDKSYAWKRGNSRVSDCNISRVVATSSERCVEKREFTRQRLQHLKESELLILEV
jgi:hypothetical protein